MESETFTVRIFKLIFLALGIRIDSQDYKFEKFYQRFCILTFPFLLVPQFASIFTLGSFYHKMIAFVFFFSTANIVAMTVWVHRQRHEVATIYTTVILKRNMFDDEYSQYFESIVKRKIKIILSCLFLIVSVVYSMPLVLKFMTVSDQMDPVFTLFIPASYPWTMDSPVSYSLTLFFQLLSDFIPSLAALGHVLCLQYFQALFETIELSMKRRLRDLDRDEVIDVEKERDRECIRILNDVIQSFNLLWNMMKTFSDIIVVYVFLAAWTFFAAGACLPISLLSTESGFLAIIRMVLFQILFGANLIFCTQLSQWCYQVNDEIRSALYQTEWYRRSTRFRKTMAIFMCLLQRSYCMKAFGISTLNWAHIKKTIKFTYSVLQVFLKLK